ncbi:hypothetical protein ACFV42_49385 [Streptomyces solisilvae]|uniref:hypothetical protein n=1 Tax=Streptomyces malaysiensis TaxID=92644 RepID=UPI00369C0B8F
MSTEARTKNSMRCFCSRQPLLATYGLTVDGKAYVHVKVYKQKRIYGNLLILQGETLMQCRECFRWHRIRIAERAKPPQFSEVQGVSLSCDDVLTAVDSGRPGGAMAKVADRDD